MRYAIRTLFLSLIITGMTVFALGFFCTAQAIMVTQLNSFGEFTSSTTFSNDFEVSKNTPEILFDGTSFRVNESVVGGVTSSPVTILAEIQSNEPLGAALNVNAFEVGMFFGNDELMTDAILSVFNNTQILGSVNVTSNGNDFVDQFIGLRSDTAFNRVEFVYQSSLDIAIDDFAIGVNPTTAPIPEPSTMLLLGLGLVGLGFYRRLRNSKS